jgi:hypothetical protein
MLIVFVCAGFAYRVDSQRADDDPKKKDFPPAAVLLAPLTWPLFLIAFVSLFLIRALFYGVFLILFTISLIIIPRISPEPTRLELIASNIGEKLLKANTQLIQLFLKPWSDEPEAT